MMRENTHLNIWWINQFALPQSQPGGGRHVQIASALAQFGCEVTIVSSCTNYMTTKQIEKTNASECDFVQIPVGWRGPKGIGKLLRMRSFGKKVSQGNWIGQRPAPDAIIGSSPSLHAAKAAATLSLRYNVPFLLEVRDLWPLSLVEVAGVSAKHPVVKHLYSLEKKVVGDAKRIISLLPNAHRYFSKFGIEESTVDWIPNGVDMNLFHARELTDNKNLVVMYVGSLGPPNGVYTILEAAKLLQSTHPEITFRIIGDGSAKAQLQQFTLDKDIHNVEFEAAIPRENVPETLAEADILVANVPSHDLYKYGISLNKLYEYLASGKPIALATTAINDPVTVAGVGPVVPSDDANALAGRIATIGSMTKNERQEIGRKGREFALQNNSFDVLAKRVLSSVQKAIRA